MPRNRIAIFMLLLLLALQALAQNANQALNDELITAARKSNVEAVKTLLAKGADVNAKTEYGATPLFYACDRGNPEVVKLLLDAGADMNVKDKFYNSTPTSWAIQRDHAEVVKLLLEKAPQSKETLTAQAIMQGQVKTSKMLLALGGFKPESLSLWLAISEKNKEAEIVEALKAAGAKPKPKNDYKIEPEALKQYEGVFKNERLELKFIVKDGKLMATTVDGFESACTPVSQHVFEVEKAVGVTATFTLEGEKITGLTWKGGGGELILKKEGAK